LLHERALPDPWRLALILGLAFALAVSTVIHPIPVRGAAVGQKVVVIVGPVGGGSIQSNYLSKGEAIADAAEARGATVVRVFSPNATYAAARAAVSGANVVVYIGHGSGYPNPYSGTLQTAWNNGWGLNRIAGIDSQDPTGHGHTIGTSMVYCGEAALEGKPKPSSVATNQWCAGGKINPAPNWVMVYSNACYTPGAGETEQVSVSSEATALARVSNYSRPVIALGGTYFATDLGSKSLVETILDNPNAGWGQIYTMAQAYVPGAVKTFVHPRFSTMQAWLQKSSGPGPSVSYFNAFAGDPSRTPAGGIGAPVPDLAKPKVTASSPFTFQTSVSQAANVTATFDKSMVGLDDWNGMELYEASAPGSALGASVSWDEGSKTVTLNPDSSLKPDSWYAVNFGNDVEDIWGNPLGDASWGFRTGGGSSPVPAATVYGPSTPLWFNPGTYVGRKVDAYGHITSSKSGSLSATSSAPTAQKGVLPGQSGTWYLITAGLWSGMWIQESAGTVLGTPPPPPPADVPSLRENTVNASLPIRERLAEHRANAACASCHRLIDPVGFSLEQFDAVGRWRIAEDGKAIDAAGGLPDGSQFSDIAGLEQALLKRPELFVRTLTEKLFTFALGRAPEEYDAAAIRKIVRDARANNYRFSSLIVGITTSTPFQMRSTQ
jgi:hypothetical protein